MTHIQRVTDRMLDIDRARNVFLRTHSAGRAWCGAHTKGLFFFFLFLILSFFLFPYDRCHGEVQAGSGLRWS